MRVICLISTFLNQFFKFYYLIFGFSDGKLEALCILVVKKIKDDFGFPGDIMTDPDVGAWIGQLPSYLTRKRDVNLVQDVNSSTSRSSGDVPTHEDFSDTVPSSSLESNTVSQMTTAQDIASFQVIVDYLSAISLFFSKLTQTLFRFCRKSSMVFCCFDS